MGVKEERRQGLGVCRVESAVEEGKVRCLQPGHQTDRQKCIWEEGDELESGERMGNGKGALG